MMKVKVEVIEKLVKLLSEKPRSIKELSEELNIGWKTCERYLKSLKNIGVVVEIKTKKVFLCTISLVELSC